MCGVHPILGDPFLPTQGCPLGPGNSKETGTYTPLMHNHHAWLGAFIFWANEPSCPGLSERWGRVPEPDEVTHAGDTMGGGRCSSLCED